MRKTITFAILFLLMVVNSAFAQEEFTADDVVFWIGEGDSEAILVVDFSDETTDPSFAWGYRFNAGSGETFADMLLAVEEAEPNFSIDIGFGGGFLNDVVYNHHSQLAGQPDWWSTWSGSSLSGLVMNGGISETLVDGGWYGTSYGFTNLTQPTVTYPAYSSLWFTADEFTYSIGEGTNSAVIVVDFVSDTGSADNSYAWQINFDGTITPQEALELIAQNNTDFEIIFDGIGSTITYGILTANLWTAYNGTNLSDWVVGNFTTAIENEDWFGISAGNDVRRPFTPVPAEVSVVETVVDVQTENEVPAEITINNGTLQLEAIVTPADFVQTVSWSVESGSELAEVDQNGLVAALGNGIVVVRATSTEDETKFGEIEIIITNQDNVSTPDFVHKTISIYPNPATEFITIVADNNIELINIFNQAGQKILTQSANNITTQTISINSFATGVYFVEIKTEKGNSVHKIVVK